MGFGSGTIIHTKYGLVPIESVVIGDWVLSRSEGATDPVYKRVLKIGKTEDNEVWTVSLFEKDKWDQARSENRMIDRNIKSRLIVTPNQSIWAKGKGWTHASELDPLSFDEEFILELKDGHSGLVDRAVPLYRSEETGVAWIEGVFEPDNGRQIDLRNHNSGEFDFSNKCFCQPDFVERWNPSSFFRCAVYDLDVDEYHTYYVGALGVWVQTDNRR